MAFLQLFRRFILRALLREKIRSCVAVIGVALGVAVMVAIRLANSSVTDTFAAAVHSVSGDASLRVRGTAGRFDELLLKEIDWLREYGRTSPVIEAYAMVADEEFSRSSGEGFPRGELLQVLGVDVLLDFGIREYQVLRTSIDDEQTARDVLTLLQDEHSVILTEKFLRRRNLRVGDEIPLVFGSRQQSFTIRGVLLDEGPARTLDGNFCLMDIAAAQLAAGRLGLIDYVDVSLEEGLDPSTALAEIQNRLPEELVAEYPDAASSRADTMISAFQFNLTALSMIAVIVGLFLIYNTVAISVAARRDEIGMLRAAGASRGQVLWLFLGEALLLAACGLVIGLPLGRLLARFAVGATAQTVETFYISGVADASAAALGLTTTDILGSIALTVPLALLAAFLPAWDAASVSPVDAVRGFDARVSAVRVKVAALVALVCLAAGWVLTLPGPVDGKPVFGFLAELMFLLGGAFLTPVILRGVCRMAKGVLSGLLPVGRVELRLASSNLLGSLSRVSVSVAALAVSLSMMMAIAIMVGSFRETVVYWLNSALSSDLAVKPVMQTSSVSEARLSKRAVDIIRSDPDVAETIWFTARQIPMGERTIRLSATEIDKSMRLARHLFKEFPLDERFPTEFPTDSVLVSESFSNYFDVHRGSMVELPTSAGVATFRVDGVYYDYASNQGTVMMDVSTYERFYSDMNAHLRPQSLSIYLKPGADPSVVRKRLLQKIGDQEQVYCVTNSEVRREAMRIFESTFTITYALQLIAIVVAGLGVASTLITLIYQRRREIGLLSLVGASYRQVRRVILFEAVLLGGVSQLIGMGMGVLLAVVLIYVINVQSFGWTIQFHFPLRFLTMSTVLVLAASGLFGLYPAVQAASANPLQTVREE